MAPMKQNPSRNRSKCIQSKKIKAILAIQNRWANTKPSRPSDVNIEELPSTRPSPEPSSSATFTSNVTQTSTSTQQDMNKDEFKVRLADLENSLLTPEQNFESTSDPLYRVVNIACLKTLISGLACPVCSQCLLSLNVSNKSGFVSNLEVECINCLKVAKTCTSEALPQSYFDVNRRLVKYFISSGNGFSAMEKFCAIMNMEGLANSSFSKHASSLKKLTVAAGELHLSKARERVRKVYRTLYENQGMSTEENDPVDLCVSFDGSWHKRGHTSNYGVGTIIELHTGFVLDYCVLSKYCHACALAKSDLGEKSPEYDIWYSGHKYTCDINYMGSSPAMEVEAAERLWRNSLKHNFRYTTVLSDGDSKSYSHIQNLNIYGEDVVITKEECVNHVSKRLGTALRKVVKDCKVKKITLGGSSYGSLKETTIVKLTKYYKNSILRNKGNVEQMKSDILATLHHCVSTDKAPKHMKCPKDADSWCFYNRAKARGEIPGSHMKNLKTPITETVLRHIAPIYQRLASYELLERCVRCETQNSNESLNSIIWSKCPKVRNVSMKSVASAVADAVADYNFGNSTLSTTMNYSGLKIGLASAKIMKRRDKRRIMFAKLKNTNKFKEYRRKQQMRKTYREQKLQEIEGRTYGAGEF